MEHEARPNQRVLQTVATVVAVVFMMFCVVVLAGAAWWILNFMLNG